MKNLVKNNLWTWLLILACLAWSAFIYKQLPDSIATHFDINGDPDRYSSKNVAFLMMPLISFVLVVWIHILIAVSPQKFTAQQSTYSISQIIFATVAFLMSLHVSILYDALYETQTVGAVLPIAMSLLIIFLGNYMGKIERNFWVGFRTPWTIISEENWKQTHRFGGKAYVILGLVSLAASVWIHSMLAPVAALLLASLVGVLYSYIYYTKYEKMDRTN